MQPGELFLVLVRFFGLVIAFASIATLGGMMLGPFGTLPVGIFLLLFAGPITRGFYGRIPQRD